MLYFAFTFTNKPNLITFKVSLVTGAVTKLNYKFSNTNGFVLKQVTKLAPYFAFSWILPFL